MDLSINGQYLITGGADGCAYIIEIKNGRYEKIGTLKVELGIYAVKISQENNFVVTGDRGGTIIAWSLGEWKPLRTFCDNQKILSIDITKNEELIITGGESCNVVLWDMVKNRDRVELKGHTKPIKVVEILDDQTNFISLGLDSMILKWRIPRFENSNLIEGENQVVMIWFSNENSLLYCYSNSPNKLSAWSLLTYTKVKEINILETNIEFYHKNLDDKLFYIVYLEGVVHTLTSYDLISCERGKSIVIGKLEVSSIAISNDNELLFIGQALKIQTFFFQKEMELYNSQIYHNGIVNKILCTPSRKYILSKDHLSIVNLIDVELMSDQNQRNDLDSIDRFKKMKASISDMKLIGSENLIIISDKLTVFYDIEKRIIFKEIQNKGYSSIGLTLDNKYLFLQDSTRLDIWTTENFSYSSFIKYEQSFTNFHISPDNRDITLTDGSQIKVHPSPILRNKIYICGDVTRRYEFLGYISSIIDASSEKYDSAFDDWVIEPFHMNALHFYAYYNFDEYLTEALNKESPFFCTAQGVSPLSIALEMDFPNCVSAILKKMKPVFEKNPFIFLSLEPTLSTLNDNGYERLHALYESIYSISINNNLPRFCSNKTSFPILVKSNSFMPKKESFKGITFSEEGNSIGFYQTFLKVPILPGTMESIEFLQSIQNCSNTRIFDSNFISIYLQEKWRQVRVISYLNAFLYVIYITLLSLYTVQYRNSSFLVYPIILNSVFLAYQITYLVSSKSKYFLDYWNYVDIPRVALFIIYAIFIWTGFYPDNDYFLAFVTLIIWVRGVAYFRVYKPTRYLINLVITACKDIAAFLFIVFYSTLSFALVFFALDTYDGDFFSYANIFYQVNLGITNTTNFVNISWAFYVMVTIMNPIIMINLLISILGDTYGTVKDEEVTNDAQELISLVLESELLLFWRRNRTDKAYLHVCDVLDPEITSSEDSMIKKMKNLKRKTLAIMENLDIETKSIISIQQTLVSRNAGISKLIEKYESKQIVK